MFTVRPLPLRNDPQICTNIQKLGPIIVSMVVGWCNATYTFNLQSYVLKNTRLEKTKEGKITSQKSMEEGIIKIKTSFPNLFGFNFDNWMQTN